MNLVDMNFGGAVAAISLSTVLHVAASLQHISMDPLAVHEWVCDGLYVQWDGENVNGQRWLLHI